MQTKTQTEITLEEIKQTLADKGLAEARNILTNRIGSTIKVSGQILKVIKRNDELKLLIDTQIFKVFAEFENTQETFRKGNKIELTGILKSFGYESVVIEKAKV